MNSMSSDVQALLLRLSERRAALLPELCERVWDYEDEIMVTLWNELTHPERLPELQQFIDDQVPLNPVAEEILTEAVRVARDRAAQSPFADE